MTEQAVEAAIAPLIADALEDLHKQASAEITRLEASIPPRLAAAEQGVQNYVGDLRDTLHRLVARIDQHRQGAPASTPAAPVATPPVAATPAPQPAPSTPTQPAATTTPAAAK